MNSADYDKLLTKNKRLIGALREIKKGLEPASDVLGQMTQDENGDFNHDITKHSLSIIGAIEIDNLYCCVSNAEDIINKALS